MHGIGLSQSIPLFLQRMETMDFFNQIRDGNLEAIRKSMETQPDLVHARDQRGSSPLIMAAYYNHEEVVDELIDKGAPVDDRDGSGNTALMGVCFKGYEGMARRLVEAGADVNARNGMGGTCLIFAVTFNRIGIARLLVECGADVQALDTQGHSALYYARTQGLDSLLPLLEHKS